MLTEKTPQAVKPEPQRDRYLTDGGGLYARVLAGRTGTDERVVFQWRYKLHGRTRYFHCGTCPHTSLAEACRRRDDAHRLRDQGIDPVGEKERLEAARRAREQAEALEKTVRELFEDWHRRYLAEKRKDGGALVRQFMECDVLPHIGELKARDVRRAHIVEVVDRITDRGAKRKANAVLSLLKQLFA